MKNTTATGKAFKGTVQVIASNGRLQLRFRALSKRHYLSLGLPDSETNRKVADMKARQIELDIISGNFDASLDKYRPPKAIDELEEDAAEAIALPSLMALWQQFCDVREPKVAPGTWENGYLVNTSHLKRCPYQQIEEAQKIFDWATATLKSDPAKRFIQAMGACCKWAVKSQLIAKNPFEGMTSEIKVKKASTEDNDIDPFTKEEREMIIEAFADDRYYAMYTGLVRFLFYTGCRPSEAIALQWKHISKKDIVFEQAVVRSKKGLLLKQGLKTQANRKFPVNQQLQELMAELRTAEMTPEDFVFPGAKKGLIDFHNFRNRAWVSVIKKIDIRYRKPYQTRHTFITQCLESGISVQQVAKWVGNTPQVIMAHYAGVIAQVQVPEI